jgi:hypothetical protein
VISLTLQACPLDLQEAFELVQLICEIEPKRRPETEFFLIYRKDCPIWIVREFEKLAGRKFGFAKACMARNHAEGWPYGSNMLAASAMMEMTILARQQLCRNDGYLLFEPDCAPLERDWLERLSSEWERAKSLGKEAVGHWHQQGDETTLHMNGNAIFHTMFHERHPDIWVGPGLQGWDYWFREKIIPLSCDSDLIYQHYSRPTITAEELFSIIKNGQHPVFLHGIKDASARRAVWDKIHQSA